MSDTIGGTPFGYVESDWPARDWHHCDECGCWVDDGEGHLFKNRSADKFLCKDCAISEYRLKS